jgi:DNA-binding LacI/PurR family transcriptional regulator
MANKPHKSITSLQDLADIAGVSRATASRALNDSPKISEKTKSKLRYLAQKHNYSINRQARDFRLRRTSVVSVVFMLDIKSKQQMSDPFFLDMLGGIADSLAENDYDLLLSHAPIANILDLKEGRVIRQSDGVIFIGQAEQHEELMELASGDSRMVVWGYPLANKNYVVVGSDNVSGGYQATKHLLENGRRKIAFFGATNNPENAARFEGYNKALQEYGLTAGQMTKVDVPFDMQRARESIAAVIDSGTDLDAVVCISDVMALATISTLQEMKIRVPDDIAVVGYDNITLAAYGSPPLTTVSQNIHRAGEIMVESLLRLINGEVVDDVILPSELVVRKSSVYEQ